MSHKQVLIFTIWWSGTYVSAQKQTGARKDTTQEPFLVPVNFCAELYIMEYQLGQSITLRNGMASRCLWKDNRQNSCDSTNNNTSCSPVLMHLSTYQNHLLTNRKQHCGFWSVLPFFEPTCNAWILPQLFARTNPTKQCGVAAPPTFFHYFQKSRMMRKPAAHSCCFKIKRLECCSCPYPSFDSWL